MPPRLIAVGDNCLDVYLTKNQMTVGGNALNVAVHWHNLGAHSRYFGAVGQDRYADFILTAIKQAGLNPQDVDRRDGTTAITIIANEAGERRFLHESLGVGADYLPSPVHYQQILEYDFVHLGTNTSPELLRCLSQDKIRFSIDLSNHPFDHLDLAGASLIFASGGEEEENIQLLSEKIQQKGGRRILITCGKAGAYYCENGQIQHVPSCRIEVVDTCGAGDSFLACFVLEYFFKGQDSLTALRTATNHAAQTCTHEGGFVQLLLTIPEWLPAAYAQPE